MNVAQWLARGAQRWGARPALFNGTECVADYAGFHDRAARLAGWLTARGIARGDRVGIFLGNTPDYLVIQYGVWLIGAAVVPINARLHPRETDWILEDAQAVLCFVSSQTVPGLEERHGCDLVEIGTDQWRTIFDMPANPVVTDCAEQDLAWLFYTSGTTGHPKGVTITHRMLREMALSYFADVDAVTNRDTALYAAPMSHGAGLYNLMHVLAGARHVVPESGGVDPQEILDLAEHHGRVHMFCAPTIVKRLTDYAAATGRDGKGLRSIVYGGAPMYGADIERALDVFGPVFLQIYGQGECPMCITALSRDEIADRTHENWRARLASVGRAQSVTEIRISGPDGAPLPSGQTGEILVRGGAVMPGYWRNEQATRATIRNGWMATGDMGFLDNEGYLTLKDRSKDLIISGGNNIYPREVEEVLLTHPNVSEAAVVGVPHRDWGEEVVAFVVAGAGFDPAALDQRCLDTIARYKRPKRYVEIAELPKNNYGKVLKTELRDLLN